MFLDRIPRRSSTVIELAGQVRQMADARRLSAIATALLVALAQDAWAAVTVSQRAAEESRPLFR